MKKAKANRRSAGTALAGHIRYEWINVIGYVNYNKRKFLDSDNHRIRFKYEDADKSKWIVEVNFPNSVDTAFVSNDILHKLSAYRLAMSDEKSDEEYTITRNNLRNNILPDSNPKDFSVQSTGYSYPAPGGRKFRPLR